MTYLPDKPQATWNIRTATLNVPAIRASGCDKNGMIAAGEVVKSRLQGPHAVLYHDNGLPFDVWTVPRREGDGERTDRRRRSERLGLVLDVYDNDVGKVVEDLGLSFQKTFIQAAEKLEIPLLHRMSADTTSALIIECNFNGKQTEILRRYLLQHTGCTVLEVVAKLKERRKERQLEMQHEAKRFVSSKGDDVRDAVSVTRLSDVTQRNLDEKSIVDRSFGPGAPPGCLISTMGHDHGGQRLTGVHTPSYCTEACSTRHSVVVGSMPGYGDCAAHASALMGDLYEQHAQAPYQMSLTFTVSDDRGAGASLVSRSVVTSKLDVGHVICARFESSKLAGLERSGAYTIGGVPILVCDLDGDGVGVAFCVRQSDDYVYNDDPMVITTEMLGDCALIDVGTVSPVRLAGRANRGLPAADAKRRETAAREALVALERAVKALRKESRDAAKLQKADAKTVQNLAKKYESAKTALRGENTKKSKGLRAQKSDAKSALDAAKKQLQSSTADAAKLSALYEGSKTQIGRFSAIVQRLEALKPNPAPPPAAQEPSPATPRPEPSPPRTDYDPEEFSRPGYLRVLSFHAFRSPLPKAYYCDDVTVIKREMLDFVCTDLCALYDAYGLLHAANSCCLYCHATPRDRAAYWLDVMADILERSLATIDADYIKSMRSGSAVNGVKGPRIAKTPLDRVVPAPLHVLTLGAIVDLWKYLLKLADELDGHDDDVLDALEEKDRLKELLSALEDAAEARGVVLAAAEKDEKVAVDAQQERADGMPVGARGHTTSLQTALAKGASEQQYDDWCIAWNAQIEAKDRVAALKAEATKAKAEMKQAQQELAEATDALKHVEKPARESLIAALGSDSVKIDASRHFGGESFAGGKAALFLERRDAFFQEWLKDKDAAFAKSVRERFLPVMALLERLNHLGRRAVVLSFDEMDEIQDLVLMYCSIHRATFQCRLGSDQATPKVHIIEAHYVKFMLKWHVLGLLGEDALESTHAKLNRLERRVFNVRNSKQRTTRLVRLAEESQDGAALEAIAASRARSKRPFKAPGGKRKSPKLA